MTHTPPLVDPLSTEQYTHLATCSCSEVEKPYPNQPTWGRVIKVYDGDTLTCILRDSHGFLQEWIIRMIGYDAPELRTKDNLERIHAYECRDTLAQLVNGKVVMLEPCGKDKYGRLLARVWAFFIGTLQGIPLTHHVPMNLPPQNSPMWLDVNKWMMDHTMVKPYDGKKKGDCDFTK